MEFLSSLMSFQSSAEPVYSPTMAGGLFAIDRKFFEKLGYYDPHFDIWGGENLELSFKSWMCGGTLEIVPCSHVGHIFRKRSPYKVISNMIMDIVVNAVDYDTLTPTLILERKHKLNNTLTLLFFLQWRSGVNVLKRNSVRLAEVWLDDYAQYYYQRIGNEKGDYGDVSERKELRLVLNQLKRFQYFEYVHMFHVLNGISLDLVFYTCVIFFCICRRKLGCKSFKWYLDNIYPELFIPGEAVASGEVTFWFCFIFQFNFLVHSFKVLIFKITIKSSQRTICSNNLNCIHKPIEKLANA